MAKTQEELNALKEEVEAVSRKLHELTDEELEQVTGGGINIPLNGATATANVGGDAAGIGGGAAGSASNITISGGTVTADGGHSGSGL